VKRVKDAFEKPFRNNATSMIPSSFADASRLPATDSSGIPSSSTSGTSKGKERESSRTTSPVPESTSHARPPREPSPVWDIELDLDLDGNNSPESGPPPVTLSRQLDAVVNTTKRIRSPSPMWDIELDLNASDDDQSDRFVTAGLL